LSKTEYILFIFEGEKTEKIIYENLIENGFLSKKEQGTKQQIIRSYGHNIYQLYKKFDIDGQLDEDLDLTTLMKLENDSGEVITSSQVSETYLFFDYDSHCTNSSLTKLESMLKLFNDEFEYGKLFVSYPMVEALLDISEDSEFSTLAEESNQEYKKLSRARCREELKHFNDYTKDIWHELIQIHSKKANFIVNDSYELPKAFIDQIDIFNSQKSKYIETYNKVSVVSAFPLFLLDYYGISIFDKEFNSDNERDEI
jgi:tRNA nucleotidyltransferase/poly(A) polymerase